MSSPASEPFVDQKTRDAATRLTGFLRREIMQLPRGHRWRTNYQRQLVSTLARFPELSAEE